MPTYEIICALVQNPSQDETHYVVADNPGHALTENFAQRPGTFVKSYTEVPKQDN
jgi:hypothetical protein